jgi:hypothetical protein
MRIAIVSDIHGNRTALEPVTSVVKVSENNLPFCEQRVTWILLLFREWHGAIRVPKLR